MSNTIARYEQLLDPSAALIEDIARLSGDILILGAGGKMGPALALLAKKAVDAAGLSHNVIAVSRFSDSGLVAKLEDAGIQTITADLLDDQQLQALPNAQNVIYMAGTKFGTTGNEGLTWAMNSYLPGRVAQKFFRSNIVVFSTGNVYPLCAVTSGGVDETVAPSPNGEYAQSCLGRERMFQYYADKHQTPTLIFRLNYANDVHYGVLVEIAKAVNEGRTIALEMGHVNVIWQNDANEVAIRSLLHCRYPAKLLNVTGPETLSVRWVANEFGKLLGKQPQFSGEEQDTALLSNAAEAFDLFGYPGVTTKQMIRLIAAWTQEGGATINKPTHFQERSGNY